MGAARTGCIWLKLLEQLRRLDSQSVEHILSLAIEATQPVGARREATLLELPCVHDRCANGVGIGHLVTEDFHRRRAARGDRRQRQERDKHTRPHVDAKVVDLHRQELT